MKNSKLKTPKGLESCWADRTIDTTLELYKQAISTISTGIVILDAITPEFPIIYSNSAFEQLTGYSSQEILGRDCFFLQGKDTNRTAIDKIKKALRIKQQCRVIFKNYRKNGSSFWNQLTISPISNAKGYITHFIAEQVDVTEQKQAEQKLQEQAVAMNACIDGIAIINQTGEFTYLNEAYVKICGYQRPEDLLGKKWEILYDEAEMRIFRQYVLPVVQKQKEWRGEAVSLRRDGSKYRQELTLSTLPAQKGIFCVVRDISERKQVEVALEQVNEVLERQISQGRIELRKTIDKLHKETIERQQMQATLKESEILLRSIVTNLPIILFTVNSEGIFLLLEGEGLKPLNLRPEDVVGKSIFELYSQQTVILHHIRQTLSGRETTWISEIKDLVYESWAIPMKNTSGEVLGLIGMSIDITSHVKTEQILRQQAERERLVREIAANIRRSLNIEQVLNTAVAEVRQFLQTDRVLVYRFESDLNGVVVVESVAENFTPILGITIQDPCFKGKYVKLYQQGRIRVIPDIYNSNLNQCHIDLLAKYEVRSNLVVPILQGENLWGLLIVHHCRESRQWQESEVNLLSQLSEQIAIAIQQSELYQKLENELIERLQTEAALRQREKQLFEKASELEETLYQLQATQSQLIQSEKMSSLGQLVAGVAHEINNPVNFIYGNITPAKHYIEDLFKLIKIYQKYSPKSISEIEEKITEIDLDFIKNDLPNLLNSMLVGAERIREIVRSLRYFSRHDESDRKTVDIHEGIDSTLLILQNRLKAKSNYPVIQVIQEYGNLPKIECYPGQLNQVFMNILSNAIDALEESHKYQLVSNRQESHSILTTDNEAPTIRIRTELGNNGKVGIRIADNGSGITEKVRQRLFDPFFTTKEVGKGTGLGLSISYQIIVEKHGGELHCFSQPGQGTEFLIVIPSIQKKDLGARS